MGTLKIQSSNGGVLNHRDIYKIRSLLGSYSQLGRKSIGLKIEDFKLEKLLYSRTCLERPPHGSEKYRYSRSRQVIFGDRLNYIEM